MLFLILSLVLNFALAQESSEIYLKPCFSSDQIANAAKSKLNFIKANSDKIQVLGNCLDILTVERRRKLYLSYLTQNFGQYDLQSIKPKQCRLELIKETYKTSHSLSGKVNSQKLGLLKEIQKSKSTSTSSLIMSSGSNQTLSIKRSRLIKLNNQIQIINESDSVQIECIVSQKGYHVKISSNDQENTLITSLFIKPNEIYDLGGLNNSKKDDKKQVGLKGAELQKTILKELTHFRIKVK
jgi:hypothetical protein